MLSSVLICTVITYWDRQTIVKNVDPDQILQNMVSDQGLHCDTNSNILDTSTVVEWTISTLLDKYNT